MSSLMLASMTDSDLQDFANRVKDSLAVQLNLPDLDSYYVVLGRPSAWGRFKKFVLGSVEEEKEKDTLRLVVMKRVTHE